MSLYQIAAAPTVDLETFRIEQHDGSLSASRQASLSHVFHVSSAQMTKLFFEKYELGYIVDYFVGRKLPLRVVTHPSETSTCFEKAEMLGDWSPLNVIKAVYLHDTQTAAVYAVVVPETGCFVDRKRVRQVLSQRSDEVGTLDLSPILPKYMVLGTCSPFVVPADLAAAGGCVTAVLFDSETLIEKKHDRTLDDFSFGLDRRLSLQMNYYHCYKMLKHFYPALVRSEEIMGVACSERLVRTRGRLRIQYDIESTSYRIAKQLDEISRSVSRSISNDRLDEAIDKVEAAPAEA